MRHADRGATAILFAILVPVFLVFTAITIDIGRWYVEVAKVQAAADAAALSGVTWMPDRFDAADGIPNATTKAQDTALQNGFPDTSVEVLHGQRESELLVTVSSTVENIFGRIIPGINDSITIRRSSLADFQGPALLGSPCNAFGNEPPSTTVVSGTTPAAALPVTTVKPGSPPGWTTCQGNPGLWAMIEGPRSDKQNGDRYANLTCTSGTDGCTSTTNDEYRDDNYYWTVRVPDDVVTQSRSVSVQIYDPAFVPTNQTCGALDTPANFGYYTFPYAPSDAVDRYADVQNEFCSGDLGFGGSAGPVNTSFELLTPNLSNDPGISTAVATCTKQFAGYSTFPTDANLATEVPTYDGRGRPNGRTASGSYRPGLASVFHQWVNLCTFQPTVAGDYYLHVRSNVALGGTGTTESPTGVYSFNSGYALPDPSCKPSATTGSDCTTAGVNSFSLRAYAGTSASNVTSDPALSAKVAVSGWERMPMWINDRGPATFNLIQVLPNARGKSFTFSGFDFGDCGNCEDARGNTIPSLVEVLMPTTATGDALTTTSCVGTGPQSGYLPTSSNRTDPACSFRMSSDTHQGKLQQVKVDIPLNYECGTGPDRSVLLGDCWFRMRVTYSADPNDVTTWDASINGDVVRLVK